MKVIPETYFALYVRYGFITITVFNTTAGGLLVPEGIIRIAFSAAVLGWRIRYI